MSRSIIKEGIGWYSICVKNWMSMEDAAKGIWLWINRSKRIPTMDYK
jgi:hypothetical protein